MSKYGLTYQVADFVRRLVPLRTTDSWSGSFVRNALTFVQEIDNAQNSNPRITLSFHANDGLWVYLDGSAQFFLKPTQKYLLLHIFSKNDLYAEIEKQPRRFKDRQSASYADGLWRIGETELSWLLKYIAAKWKPSKRKDSLSPELTHPRYIPGLIRQAALTDFIAGGRICAGVEGRTKKHKVNGEPIEFDHILPHSHGGASTEWNVQILCQECNRVKRATAA